MDAEAVPVEMTFSTIQLTDKPESGVGKNDIEIELQDPRETPSVPAYKKVGACIKKVGACIRAAGPSPALPSVSHCSTQAYGSAACTGCRPSGNRWSALGC